MKNNFAGGHRSQRMSKLEANLDSASSFDMEKRKSLECVCCAGEGGVFTDLPEVAKLITVRDGMAPVYCCFKKSHASS